MNPSVIVSGVISGILYALSGLALVIVYRSSRLLNFALGGMGGVAAYLAFTVLNHGGSYFLAYAAALSGGAVMGGLIEVLVVRRVAGEEHIVGGIATLGLLLMLTGMSILIWGTESTGLRAPFVSSHGFVVFGVRVSAYDLYVVGAAAILLTGVHLLIFHTPLGLRMRATAEGPVTAAITGVSVRNVSRWSWVVGGVVGGVAALLVVPTTYLSAGSFTGFLFFGFAAVALGGLTSIPGVVLGGIFFGVALNVLEYFVNSQLTQTVSLVVVTVLLVTRPNGLLGKTERSVPEVSGLRPEGFRRRARRASSTEPESRVPGRVVSSETLPGRPFLRGVLRGAQLLVLAGLLAILPEVTHGGIRAGLPSFAATILAVLGLSILFGVAGQVSVGNGAFLAVGGYTAGILIEHAHIPFFAALVLAGALSFVVGMIVGLPALRIRWYVYFAVYTFMVANAVPELIMYFERWTNGDNGLYLSAPTYFQSDTARLYWLFLGISAIGILAVAVLLRSRVGRRWRATRDSRLGAAASGINVATSTVLAFGVSAALTGMSGVLQGAAVGILSPESYTIWVSIYLLVGVVVGGAGSIGGAIIGAAFITYVPYFSGIYYNGQISPEIVYGVILTAIIIFFPGGLGRAGRTLVEVMVQAKEGRWRRLSHDFLRSAWEGNVIGVLWPARRSLEETADIEVDIVGAGDGSGGFRLSPLAGSITSVAERGAREPRTGEETLLAVRGLRVAYEGSMAVRDIDFSLGNGEVMALVGPNGAGKSSVARAISGVARTVGGRIVFRGEDIVGRRPWAITGMGISSVVEGRGVFPGLTVDENLWLGASAGRTRDRAAGTEREVREAVLELFPELRTRGRQLGGSLSGGQQQMLAIARAMMSNPLMLVLDEPSLGLSPALARDVFERLRKMKEGGTTLLIIEQNTPLAFGVADRVCVLRSGEVKLTCSVEEARGHDDMIAEYLGVQTV